MKKILIICIVLLFAKTCFASICEVKKADGTIFKSYTITDESPVRIIDGYETYVDGVLQYQYSAEKFLIWGMQNVLSQEPVVSMTEAQKANLTYYFGRFADNCDEQGRDLFLAVSTSLGLTDLANVIILKARELGADV